MVLSHITSHYITSGLHTLKKGMTECSEQRVYVGLESINWQAARSTFARETSLAPSQTVLIMKGKASGQLVFLKPFRPALSYYVG